MPGADLPLALRSLDLLAEVPAQAWVTFHHRGVYTDSETFHADLAAFTGKIDMRSDRLLSMLSAGPQSMDSLVARGLLYDPEKAPPWAADAERYTIAQHLEELLADGRVTLEDEHYYRLG